MDSDQIYNSIGRAAVFIGGAYWCLKWRGQREAHYRKMLEQQGVRVVGAERPATWKDIALPFLFGWLAMGLVELSAMLSRHFA